MADGVVAERDVVAVGDVSLLALRNSEWHKVVRLAFERGGNFGWDCRNHTLQVKRVHGNFSGGGVANAVHRLRNGRETDDFGGAARNRRGCLRHAALFYTHGLRWAAMAMA